MTALADRAPFDLGRVPPATFGVLGRNFVNFFSMAIVLVGIPSLATSAMGLHIAGEGVSGRLDPQGLAGQGGMALVGWIVQIVGSFLLQAAVVTGAVSDLNGRRIGVGEMVSGRLAVVPVLLGLAILQALAEFAGFLLLVVPGFILATMWLVTVPSAVIEKTGVFGAFTRSADLTRGNRWGVFGLIVVYVIGMWVVTTVLQSLLWGFGGGLAMGISRGGLELQRGGLGLVCYTAAYAALNATLAATGVAVAYYELRRAREGVAPQALIETFS